MTKTGNFISTEDGSITCRDKESGELYHNKAGAYSEALHHYVEVCDLENRLYKQNSISVIDVCFGLGYNTFVLIDKLIELIETGKLDKNVNCSIAGIDKDPGILNVLIDVLDDKRFARLRQAFDLDKTAIEKIIADWKMGKACKLQFKAKLIVEIEMAIGDLRQLVPDFVLTGRHYDYIFHDGFSPKSMPELWTVDLFREYAKLIKSDGRIITYSAAVAVRGGFNECGLAVRKSAPLGSKSGGTIAFHLGSSEIANGSSILYLSDDETRRLHSRSSVPYRDQGLTQTRGEVMQSRNCEIERSRLDKYDSCYEKGTGS